MSLAHPFRRLLPGVLVLGAMAASPVWGQGTRGFDTTVPVTLKGEEASSLENLWILEVQLKPMRMIRVPVTDAQTGESRDQMVWYQVFRVVNRPITRPGDRADRQPVNATDPAPGPPLFIPEFTLVANDNGVQTVYPDQILPEAVAAIAKRERMKLRTTQEIIGPIPPAVPGNAPEAEALTGVATWTGLDPETDYFNVYLTGFSNAFQEGTGPDGEPVLLRRTIVEKYWRPGDRFDQNEGEFRPQGEPYWTYLPEDLKANAPATQAPAAAEVPETP